jgi:ArsR family transcriptional regulator
MAWIQVTFHPEFTGGVVYNIFTMANILPYEDLAGLLQAIGQPIRLQILLAIGECETCVCHLESILDCRQAYLSQHLMALRKAGLLITRREGRFMHYRLTDPRLLDLLHQAAELQGMQLPDLSPSRHCSCPNCAKHQTACH